jgi:hypothetical protein
MNNCAKGKYLKINDLSSFAEVITIQKTVKTLILEIVKGNGPTHVQEFHLLISDLRPRVPQHTVRARLSEMSKSLNLEEKLKPFGRGFYSLYEESNDLNSVVSYPNRGPWGDSRYRGNCSGYLVKDLLLRFKCQSVFDPADGSGTVRDVVSGINQYLKRNIEYEGRDLRKGWDILSGPLPKKQFDLVYYHPPYWDIIQYSEDSHDLCNCNSLDDFESKLSKSAERVFRSVRPGGILAILIGDKRKNGKYYALFRTLLTNTNIGQLKAIIIKIQHNCKSERQTYSLRNLFLIPIKHEYCMVFQKNAAHHII